jgi:hypothetical protein
MIDDLYFPCLLHDGGFSPVVGYDTWGVFADVGIHADCDEIFESEQNYANGYAWEEVMKIALAHNSEFMALNQALVYDSSADEFFVMASSSEAQIIVAAQFHQLYHNESELRKILRIVPPECRYQEFFNE